MTYAEKAATANDGAFQQRLIAAAVTEAQVNIEKPEPEMSVLADEIIGDASVALGMRWLVASAPVPAGSDFADDGVMLSALQHAWPIYGATRIET